MVKRVLIAFDFDHTLIDGNSDTYILRLLPGAGELPVCIKKLYTVHDWNDYQREVFRYLHLCHVTREQILSCVTEISFIEGMHELLEYLRSSKLTPTKAELNLFGTVATSSVTETDECAVVGEMSPPAEVYDTAGFATQQQCSVTHDVVPLVRNDVCSGSAVETFAAGPHSIVDGMNTSESSVQFDAIIISDANSVVIDHMLEMVGLQSVFSKVYTNPSSFDESGCLHLFPYHRQDWCSMSSVNLCKGHVLDEHCRTSHITYDVIAYVGDGRNDFCPTLRLRETDVVFPRRKFVLEKYIAKDRDKVAARVVPWDTGFDIINALKDVL